MSCKVDKELLGSAELIDNCFRIEISCALNLNMKLEILLHEWAHVISWFGAGYKEDHPGEWGLAYARIYREFLVWDFRRWTCTLA